ncbi:hypothetical protein INR49_013763, partial [Caranx melampygus]
MPLNQSGNPVESHKQLSFVFRDTFPIMASLPKEPPEDAKKQSFWMPGNYGRTVHRTDQSHQACNDIVACFMERAKVEKQYAQQLSQWSSKWKSIVDSRPLYGSLMKAWQCFFTSTERLSELHSSISQALITEEGQRVKTWQRETFPKKIFCGFKESHDNNTSFSRAQKPWSKKLIKLEKARVAYHKCCQREQTALDKEKQANENSEMSPEKKQKITEAREKATEEKEKMLFLTERMASLHHKTVPLSCLQIKDRYEKMLEDVTSYTPRYMEEMEAIFEQSQEEERKRISFLKQAFLSIHRHLDITNNESVKAVYSELHQTLMAINEQEDLRWWKNNHGPGMPTDWPKVEEWVPPVKKLKRKKGQQRKESRPVMIGGVKVRALYDYVGEEGDELSFKAGEMFLKVEEEDDQGWCRGVLSGGKEGFYPANYVEVVDSPPSHQPNSSYQSSSSSSNQLHRGQITTTPELNPKIIEQLEKIKLKKAAKPSPHYENAEFHKNLEAASSLNTAATQARASRKTALLPPHMRPAASSQSPPYSQPVDSSQTFTYDLPIPEPDLNAHPRDPNYSYSTPEGTGAEVKLPANTSHMPAPTLPPRPAFMKTMPEYIVVLPSNHPPSSSSQKSPSTSSLPRSSPSKGPVDKGPLPGNPNVVLVSLGKLLSEETEPPILGEPACCSQCGSVMDSCYVNVPQDSTSPPSFPLSALFAVNPEEKPLSAADALLLFCIDTSGSMSTTSQVLEGEQFVHRSRLQVTLYGNENFTSQSLYGSELTDRDYLKRTAASFPSPPPLSQTKDILKTQVMRLSDGGTTALGPAALLAVAMASRHPGSKVIICTDGKANTELGNLEVEDNDARTLLSSTIFYQELGEYAANQGVTVSVLSIEGTDCRLDELGRLADRTGGNVVIASPNRLHPEFEQIIENRTIATHCTVTLLLPKSLHMRGEREAGHKATREVGNVAPDTEITFQFGASEHDTDVPAPAPGSRVPIQLQIRYRQRNGQMMLRLNSSQASAALAVRGRFLDARREGELQRKLIERAIEHNHSAQDKETYQEWVEAMAPIYDHMHKLTRRQSVISDSQQSLTDAGAALFYTMKHSNRKSISLKNKQKVTASSVSTIPGEAGEVSVVDAQEAKPQGAAPGDGGGMYSCLQGGDVTTTAIITPGPFWESHSGE